MLLPEALQPWRPWLEWFDQDLALALGDLLRRLNPLIGSFRQGSSGGTPEPQGIDDLRRRGAYERLLLSEWALADEVPEEFLRRAAGGEHLFLAPREMAQLAVPSTVALFDTGPLQLGAPRLVHIALWILLARRAQAAGGRFLWGSLQTPGVLLEGGSATLLKRMLRDRSLEPATTEKARLWQEWAERESLTGGEWWWVGRQPPRDFRATHRVEVTRALTGERLHIVLQEMRRERRMTLALPEAAHAARLLEGAFQSVASSEAHRSVNDGFSLKRAPLVAFGGHHVAVLSLNQRMHVFHVPVPTQQSAKKPRKGRVHSLGSGGNIVGAAISGKQVGAITADNTHLHFWQFHGFNAVRRPPREIFSVTPGLAYWNPCIWLKDRGAQSIYVLDSAGNLVFWVNRSLGTDSPAPGKAHPFQRHVLGMAQVDQGSLVYARSEGDGAMVIEMVVPGRVAHVVQTIPVEHLPKKIFFTDGSRRWSSGRGAWAFDTGSKHSGERQTWTVQEGLGGGQISTQRLALPVGWEVCGLVRDSETAVLRLLALTPDRKGLILASEEKSESLFTAPDKIARIALGEPGLVAMLTEQRQLLVYGLSDRALRLCVSSGSDGLESADGRDGAQAHGIA